MHRLFAALVLTLAFAQPANAARDDPNLPFVEAPAPAPSPEVAAALGRLLDPMRKTIGDAAVDTVLLAAFYGRRSFAPLWVTDAGVTERGRMLADALSPVDDDGLNSTDELLAAIAERGAAGEASELAELEAVLSEAVVRYAVLPPQAASAEEALDALDEAAGAADLGRFLAERLPPHPTYWRLSGAYLAYRELAAGGDWPSVPSGPRLERGQRGPRVAVLRQRLMATGDLRASAPDPELFDAPLQDAARRFQARHGLADDGVVGFRTIDALNVPVEVRLASIARNLARLRDAKRDWRRPLISVNIAGAEIDMIEEGRITYHSRVIVGRADRPTPLLASEVTRLDFNPYWNVPVRIARVDLVPKAQKNKDYFGNLNFRVYTSYGERASEIDPGSVDWFSPEAKQYRLRQDPGPENALGPVKIDFENPYTVYLHGTSNPSLFAKPARFLSSGCIRLADPLGFAAYLLRDRPQWTRAEIDRVVARGKTESVRLTQPVPLELAYFTAWVDGEGVAHFRDDVYGLD